jgi:cysteine synthase B
VSAIPSLPASILDLVGNTPVVRLRWFERGLPGIEIWGKCEWRNPGGSVKDRAARQMILDAEAAGRLAPGMTLIDSTSGNTGVAYAMLGAAKGYRVVLVMPENVTEGRKKIVRAYGAEIVYSSPMEGSDGAIRLVRELVAASPGAYFYPDQYSNESNPRAHYLGTGREVWEQTDGRITHFLAGIGTSGTVMGSGRRLKELARAAGRHVEVIAVEPEDALHGLEGLKHMASSLVPAIYHPEELDRVLPMSTEEGWDAAEHLAEHEGLAVGHSSGAAVAGAVRVGKELVAAGKPGVLVSVLCDSAARYLSPGKWERHTSW